MLSSTLFLCAVVDWPISTIPFPRTRMTNMAAALGSTTCSPVVLGLWPIAGISTVGVTPSEARETIATAIDCGINTFDTAFNYGFDGQSDRILAEFLRGGHDRLRVISKVGQRWDKDRKRTLDASPAALTADAETSLRRLGIDSFDLLMLHSPDPRVPIEQSAQAIDAIRARGLCRSIGVCNVDASQFRRFCGEVECRALQCPLNLMQRDSLAELIPLAQGSGCDVLVYWTLMKGLLAGKISRDHQFATGDVRPTYEVFQGDSRRRTHNVIDGMKEIARSSGCTVAQLSIGWTLAQPGVTSALVGARRADQAREIAAAKEISCEIVAAIDELVRRA